MGLAVCYLPRVLLSLQVFTTQAASGFACCAAEHIRYVTELCRSFLNLPAADSVQCWRVLASLCVSVTAYLSTIYLSVCLSVCLSLCLFILSLTIVVFHRHTTGSN